MRRPYRGKLFPLERAIQLRHDGLKLEDIAFAIGYSRAAVLRQMRKINLSRGVNGRRARFGRFFPIEDAKRLYASGLTQDAVGKKLGYTDAIVGRYLRAAGFPMRPRGGDKLKRRFPLDDVRKLYADGLTCAEIGSRIGYTSQAVSYQLRMAGCAMRWRGDYRKKAV